MKLICNAPQAEEYVEYSGEIIKNGARIGYLEQELLTVPKSQTVYEYCMECEEFCFMTPKELGDCCRIFTAGRVLLFRPDGAKPFRRGKGKAADGADSDGKTGHSLPG